MRGKQARQAWAPLAVPRFRVHFGARLLSWSGGAIAPVGLAFAVLGLPGEGEGDGLGLVLACGTLPQALLLFFGGVAADRWPRVRIMVAANTVSAAAQAGAALLLWSHLARLWQLALLAAVCGAASAFFMPASSGLLADIVPARTRPAANALLRLGQTVTRVGGPAVGAALVVAAGPPSVIACDALSFAGAAALLAPLAVRGAAPAPRTAFGHQLRDGWADFRSRRWLVVMTWQSALVLPVWMAGYQLLGPVYGQRALGGAGAWGLVMSGFAAGMVGGSGVALWWRPRGVGVVACAGTAVMAVPPAAMALHTGTAGLVLAAAAAGAAASLSTTVWTGLLQDVIPPDRLGRVTAYSAFGQAVTVPLGYLAASPATRVLGLRETLGLGAVLITLLAVLPLLLPEVRLLGSPVTASGRGGAERRPPRRPRAATAVRESGA
ncbi:MFS transporter [Streptomyces syringium]|uniref:MFS transporter n=1 Tax=Streptomyces syringium TaxID=76729 RepID=UPI0034565865